MFPFNKSIKLIYPELNDLKDNWYHEISSIPYQDDFATYEEVNRTWENTPPPTEWLLENYKPTIINQVYIEDPSKYLDVDMYIQPIQAIEMIRVNFILDNKGGQD